MRTVLALIGVIFLAGCELAMIEGATIMGTEKTVGDHIVSWSSKKDCSTYRKLTGRTYCKEDDIQPKAKVHCYRTLANVTCYETPDPTGRREVGRNDHNYDENADIKK